MTVNNWNLFGHEWIVASLARDILSGRLRHAYLIAGPSSIGKRALASAFIQALLCERAEKPCGECRPCKLVAHGNHPDVILVAPTLSGERIKAEKIKVEPIRDLINALALKPVEAVRRIALITNFELISERTSNTLLKTLEEPPGQAIIILTTDSPEALLPTITSRCEIITLRPLPVALVEQALTERWQVPAGRAEMLARLSGGRLGWAINAVNEGDGTIARREERMSELRSLLSGSRAARFAYAESLSKDREALRETLDLWLGWWHDVLLIASGTVTPPVNSDQLASLRRAAEKTGLEPAQRAVEAVQKTIGLLPRNINARLAVEVLLLDFPTISSTDRTDSSEISVASVSRGAVDG